MSEFKKAVAWTLTVAVAQLAIILGWTVAIGIGGALLLTASFAVIVSCCWFPGHLV